MTKRTTFWSVLALAACGLLGYGAATGHLPGPGRADAADDAKPPTSEGVGDKARPQDQAALKAVMQSFVQAFEHRDAKALAAHWTAEGEYQNDNGVTVRGRENLEKSFARFFATTPELKAEAHPESLHFVGKDAAVHHGTATIRRGIEPAGSAHFTALFLREDGRWRLARLHESPADGDSIADLGWLVGDWKSMDGQGAEIRTTYAWDANKKFIHVRFAIKEKALALGGTQVIGVDPATGGIHTWTFEGDGGVGVSDWNRDGDHWKLDVAGTLADGRRLTETNILRRVNNDTITWQSINRSLDGADLADLAPVKVTRIKPEK